MSLVLQVFGLVLVKMSSILIRFILWGSQMFAQNFKAINPIIAELFDINLSSTSGKMCVCVCLSVCAQLHFAHSGTVPYICRSKFILHFIWIAAVGKVQINTNCKCKETLNRSVLETESSLDAMVISLSSAPQGNTRKHMKYFESWGEEGIQILSRWTRLVSICRITFQI